MKRVTEEIMPLVQQRFHAAQDPESTAFGGGSFGGVCALYAAIHYPHMFGRCAVHAIHLEHPDLVTSVLSPAPCARQVCKCNVHQPQCALHIYGPIHLCTHGAPLKPFQHGTVPLCK
eukprot:GHUV01036998.1.p3 GENE.GHUV01036998.1~~GHUV01036998.1.p3  ORF type:complete len:117 (-),score=9.42 GHUV01036998.1:14-364(-)